VFVSKFLLCLAPPFLTYKIAAPLASGIVHSSFPLLGPLNPALLCDLGRRSTRPISTWLYCYILTRTWPLGVTKHSSASLQLEKTSSKLADDKNFTINLAQHKSFTKNDQLYKSILLHESLCIGWEVPQGLLAMAMDMKSS